MTDLGHDLLFGIFPPPVADRAQDLVGLAVLAEDLGLDLLAVQDHPYQRRFLDTWTLLSVVAGRTRRLRVAPDVANLPLRPPAVLARSAASLDVLSGGRVELGLGAGAHWDAIEAMGGPRRTPGEAVTALAEAVAVIRALWTPGPTPRIHGEHYQLTGARSGPFPVHPLGLWIGAYGPRMLRLTGELADGWWPSVGPQTPPGRLAELATAVDEAAEAAGRAPSDVRRVYNVSGTFGTGAGFLAGSPADWAEQLTALALGDGVSAFALAVDVTPPAEASVLRRFAGEVAPAVREAVAAGRSSARRP